jgi:hypothetical protein
MKPFRDQHDPHVRLTRHEKRIKALERRARGYTVVKDGVTDYTRRFNLKFTGGAAVSDDGIDTTIVDVPSPSGYTPPTDQEISRGTVTLAPGNQNAVPMANFAGATLLDYTNPLIPKVITAGVYALAVQFESTTIVTAGARHDWFLSINASGTGPQLFSSMMSDGSAVFGNESVTWYLTPSDGIRAIVTNHDVSNTYSYTAELTVQRIS